MNGQSLEAVILDETADLTAAWEAAQTEGLEVSETRLRQFMKLTGLHLPGLGYSEEAQNTKMAKAEKKREMRRAKRLKLEEANK